MCNLHKFKTHALNNSECADAMMTIVRSQLDLLRQT